MNKNNYNDEDYVDIDLIKLAFNNILNYECKTIANNKLYHYTSIKNILSIINNHEIYFTHVECFNDKTEGKLIFDFYNKAINSLMQGNKISTEYYNILKTITKADVCNTILYIDKEQNRFYKDNYDCFVLCFSESVNSKRCYHNFCENYGGNICFSSLIVDHIKEEFNNKEIFIDNLWIEKILYSDNDCKEYIENKILEFFNSLNEYKIDLNDNIEKIKHYIINLLKHKQYSFVKSNFNKQEEIRIIYWRPKNSILSPKILKRKKIKNDKTNEIESLKVDIGKDNGYTIKVSLSNNCQNLDLEQKQYIKSLNKYKVEIEFIDFTN